MPCVISSFVLIFCRSGSGSENEKKSVIILLKIGKTKKSDKDAISFRGAVLFGRKRARKKDDKWEFYWTAQLILLFCRILEVLLLRATFRSGITASLQFYMAVVLLHRYFWMLSFMDLSKNIIFLFAYISDDISQFFVQFDGVSIDITR